jgi:type IV pilus assembly protein PilQ
MGFLAAWLLASLLESPQPRSARVSLDLKDAPLEEILRVLGEAGGLQVVLDPDVHCSLTLRLREAPLGTALNAVFKACSVSGVEENRIVRVATLSRLTEEARQERELKHARTPSVAPGLYELQLSYAKAQEIAPLLKRLLAPRGDVQFDPRTNILLIIE